MRLVTTRTPKCLAAKIVTVKLLVTYAGIKDYLKTSMSNLRNSEASCTDDKYSETANGKLERKFWMVVPCILFEIRFIYQLDAIFVYFSSTCFGLTRPSSGAIEL